MASISITAANVVKGNDAAVTNGTAGETVTAGMAVYLNTTTNKWLKAQCDGTAAEAGASGLGVALNGASDGQALAVQTGGTITIGGTAVKAAVYVVGATAGDIAPTSDVVTTGNYRSILGVATTTGILYLRPLATSVTLP
jgi:hypothetical protein